VSAAAEAATDSGWTAATFVALLVGVLTLVGALITAVVALVTNRTTTRQRTENDHRQRWWERAQWAMERAYDKDRAVSAVGLTVLSSLGKSDLTTPDDQVMLARVAVVVLTGGATP
jgi:hypothetical protein